MQAAAGLMFLPLLLVFVAILARIPPPGALDEAHRGKRAPMNAADRIGLVRRHGLGLAMLIVTYFLVTIARSLRADFAPEIWQALGVSAVPLPRSRSPRPRWHCLCCSPTD